MRTTTAREFSDLMAKLQGPPMEFLYPQAFKGGRDEILWFDDFPLLLRVHVWIPEGQLMRIPGMNAHLGGARHVSPDASD